MKNIRSEKEPELLKEMFAHSGKCNYCDGIVKMRRNEKTMLLEPKKCVCFGCGQRYFMEIKNISDWEQDQWAQKMMNM